MSPAASAQSAVRLSASLPAPAATRVRVGWLGRAARVARRSKSAVLGATIFGLLSAVALAAPALAPYDPGVGDIALKLQPPSASYLLGTDELGRDVLSRVIFGARISLSVGALGVVLAAVLGITLGLISGYLGGIWDAAIMAVAEVQLAFPFLLLAIAIIIAFGPSLTNAVIVLGITSWVWYGRIIRAETLSLKQREFVEAARALGCTHLRILGRHIFPQVVTPLLVISTLQLARMIVLEATLSFLGLGVQPPTPSWGGMLSDGRAVIFSAWWVATAPGVAITLGVLGINLLGDGLRDLLDPRLRT